MPFKYWVEGPVDGYVEDEAIDRACSKASKVRMVFVACAFIVPPITGLIFVDFSAISEVQLTVVIFAWVMVVLFSGIWASKVVVHCPRCNERLVPHKREELPLHYMTVCEKCKTRCRVRPVGRWVD